MMRLATDISNKLIKLIPSKDFDGLVGMGAHMEKLKSMLCLDSDEVKMIGILGPSGIGKTTIARFLFNELSNRFHLRVFMEDIRERYSGSRPCYDEYSAKLQLQERFLSQLFNSQHIKILHLGVLKERLKKKKVLVVLDDVDRLEQLDALAKETEWFGPGSRILITTQNKKLLNAHRIEHIYEVGFSPPDEASQILCLYAFGQKSPKDGFENLASKVTELSGGLPLKLKLMGSYLRGMSKQKWENILPRLRAIVDSEIGNIVKSTYGKLNERTEDFAKKFSEWRQERIITKQDLKEDLYKSVRQARIITNQDLKACDTLQYSFASHLSVDFRRKGIHAVVNSNDTLNAIERISAYVVIFSKSCFSSTTCLNKLAKVLQCRKETGQLMVPVFYGISPSDVVVPEQIREWSSVLQELRELPGHQSREECSECELVEEIVKYVYEKLFPAQHIGINSRLLKIEQLLCKQPWGIRHIGIWGMPGIGKTTLAKAVFDQISGGYEASCFIEHFDKAFHEMGLPSLMAEHFGTILNNLSRVCSTITRPSLPRDKLTKKRTLVVLDDVHNPLVARSFLGGIHWFGLGSLIIITSRDKQVFRHCLINHIYEVQSLNEDEALQLISQCAFGRDRREQQILEVPIEVNYANGNPLALSFYGRELMGKTLSKLEAAFLTPNKIHDLFKCSYETLNKNEKNIFLDIACFFNGESVDYVIQLLEGCGFFPHVGINVLVEKSLLTISENRVIMHRIIQDFGREINNNETVQMGRRRRLWEPWTIKLLLEDDKDKGTEDIEGIVLDASKLVFDVKPTAFENMLNLRFLKIYCSSYENQYEIRLPEGLESLPYELRLLHWEDYPLPSLPQDFDPCHLVELNLAYSRLQKLWGGTKNLKMLKTVRLCHSLQLTEIDDIGNAENIELIDLRDCIKLPSFPATGQLQHLRVVNLSGCREIKIFKEVSANIYELNLQGTGIRELPISIGNATNLQKLNLENCSSLVELPSSFGNVINLKELYIKGCLSLAKLPASIGNAINLEILDLSHCLMLEELPSSFGNAINLKELYIEGCSSLAKLPASIGNAINLEILDLSHCLMLEELPSSFGNAINLKELYIEGCSSLAKLPASIGNAINLEILDLSHCLMLEELPSSFGNAINLKELYIEGCSSLAKLPASIGNAINLEILDLSHCLMLEELPSSFGNAINLKELYIEGCSSLAKLPASIGNAINLEILDLSHCLMLEELPSSFGNAINLKELYIEGCSSLAKLPASIGNAINLEILDLSHCLMLEELPSSFGNAINLKELYIEGCSSLAKLPASIGNAINLEILDLSHCLMLEELPSSFGNAINLKELYIEGCSSLAKLPASIGNAINLEILDLSHCLMLEELPSSFGNAINLKELYIEGCSSLAKLPASIGNAINLEILDLSHCLMLEELPSSFGNAINLKELYIEGCSSLAKLPASIGNAINLEILDLSHCLMLEELPSSFGNAINLKELYIEGCSSLAKLPASIGNAINLEILDLSHCLMLEELPSSFGNAINLKELYIEGCSSLAKLPASIGNAINLEILDLSHCLMLEELPSSFGNAINLKELYIKGCSSLAELPSSIGNATNLEILDLSHCLKLEVLPSSIGNATNLKKLNLTGCLSLRELPASVGNATNLEIFDLTNCSRLLELPSSFGSASLKELYLTGCSSLVELPASIKYAVNLEILNLENCSSLLHLPSSIRNATAFQKLNLTYPSSLVDLPSSSGGMP
ncbi:PREDICTED: protein SUPPRESSOR OF npr1-1, CONSTITUTIVE 1-like isoform X2 [Camelina sativa]|uniref:Protein SUPPRESSOR OF npr1-1, CONSTITUTIVE 1-like isoform X2 n=1 Tax=Camelina sativa TaxID=90675 RepID=A0ABM1QS09_CAMSA|nr:PREDICTED: protein SUPPRESSOR OF npr1-1, CONSTITUTIVE 1-like isoform X2 [Camelina sativa]